MFFGLAAGAFLAATAFEPLPGRAFWIAGAACVQCRLLANLLDGMVALERGVASPVGELYNEVPDRVSDPATLIGLGLASGGDALLGFGAAGAALFVAYVRAIGKVAGGSAVKQEFCGPMAKQHRMFIVTLTALYCGLAPAAWQPEWPEGRESYGLPAVALAIIIAGCMVTAPRRLLRIAAALRSVQKS
jgi:phosphatidylglycerophosphate synthase